VKLGGSEFFMTWSDFYLLCFLVGFSLSVLSFLAGAVHLHLPFKMHLPFHGGHFGAHAGGGPIGGHASGHLGGAAHGGGPAGKGASQNSRGHLTWFNATTIMAFLAWFGGVGYILSTHSNLALLASLTISLFAGFAASYVVFRFMAALMRSGTGEMHEWDYRLEGSVGTVSMPIRSNGIGEVIFEQNGSRRSVSARCDGGKAVALGAEVVIERYEDGIAYVQLWDEFTK
jgi:membrane protein implicated in regulation of membrane protease activity